eukprot:TRINITY_DN434_c0_g1_i3.p1 TRINITY_DN434_c0_g1~~TRINITY_DN434_c0_g1_i3.p1  ORF type:complete len:395 (-),score=162.90 TRINITY_DN434_c0_g1_i3:38-1222(-)
MSQPVSLSRPDRPSHGGGGGGSTPYPPPAGQPGQQPPYGAPPGGQPPYGAPPGGQPGYGAPPGGQPGYGAPPGGQPPYGQPGSQPPYGQQPGGAPPGGQPPYGQQPGGAPPGGQPPYGQPGGQPPYGQPGGAPPGGQPPYGQQPGQPPYGGQPGQSPYGAPPGGQPPYGQQPGAGYPGAPPGGQYGQQGMNPALMSAQPMPGGGSVSLVKGQNMNLSKVAPTLRRAMIGLGWDVRQTPGAPFDLDASVFLVDAQNRVLPQNFIFYNNKMSADGAVTHQGDNLTGAGEGDDERILIDLNRVNPSIQRIVFVCTIYEAEQRQQNFGQVSRAFIRVTDADVNREVLRFDLTEDASMFNTMTFGELYRYQGEWKFKAIGQGGQGGLRMLGSQYGLQLA